MCDAEKAVISSGLVVIGLCALAILFAGCARNGSGGYTTPGFTPPAKTECVAATGGLKCKSS